MYEVNDNRIVISILFGIGFLIFIFLFLDSHYKELGKFCVKHKKK